MKPKDALIVLFAVVLLGALALAWMWPTGLKRAPDVALNTIDGREIRLAELRGRPLLVTFWATTCSSCVKEMPHLVDLYREYGPRGLEIIGIAMYYDPPRNVVALVEARALPYPIAIDTQAQAAQAFGDVRLTPTSFLIAPDGRIVQQRIGDLDMELVRRQLDQMLTRSAAAAPAAAGG